MQARQHYREGQHYPRAEERIADRRRAQRDVGQVVDRDRDGVEDDDTDGEAKDGGAKRGGGQPLLTLRRRV
jgi:hypothetical protein